MQSSPERVEKYLTAVLYGDEIGSEPFVLSLSKDERFQLTRRNALSRAQCERFDKPVPSLSRRVLRMLGAALTRS